MKILVTGATGFLGSHVCQRLLHDGHQVMILRRPSSNTDILSGLDLSHAVGDVTDAESVDRAVRGQDAVVHVAANLTYWRRLNDAQMQVNLGGTRTIAAACRRHGARLLQVSSVGAIGIPPDKNLPADETFVFNLERSGLNYHISKKRAEEAVLDEVSRGLDAVIVNPGSIQGPSGKRYRGGDGVSKIRRNKIVLYFTGGINVVHVDDVADGILRALKQGRRGERYILGGENWTRRQMSELVAKMLGVKRVFVPVVPAVTRVAATIFELMGDLTGKHPSFTYDTHYTSHRFHFYNSDKAKKELGYNPRGYREILRECLEWAQA
jgi:dihydroflavonol-4-reductase